MLIETVDEMNELPAGSVILDRVGKALQTSTDYDWPYKRVQKFLDERGPFTLIYPRRYGDDDFRRAGKAAKNAWQMTACTGDDYVVWPSVARAALDALEEK